MRFEILCLDSNEDVKARTIKSFLYALLGNDCLFDNATMDENAGKIVVPTSNIVVEIKQFPTDKMLTGARYSVAYTVIAECDNLDVFDTFRMQLVDHIKMLGFSNIRILLDEVSMTIATELYPTIYALENNVRTFVTNFFLKNLGVNWTRLALSGDTLKKIKDRKQNDRIFLASGKIDGDVTLIDFDDLGRILYSENSILSSKKADNVAILIEKISSATDLEALKSEVLEGNFYKYFKDCFTQKDFQTKWFDLYYYRNKLAHNSFFSCDEATVCRTLCNEITSIIDKAYEKLDTFKLSASDQEALMVAVNELVSDTPNQREKASSGYMVIEESELLEELKLAKEDLPYVGLRYFVVNILGEKGYDYDSTFALINYLEDRKVVKLSKVDSPDGRYPITTLEIG